MRFAALKTETLGCTSRYIWQLEASGLAERPDVEGNAKGIRDDSTSCLKQRTNMFTTF